MKSLLTPAIWIAAVAILLHTGMIAPSAAIITFALHAALVVGLLMAWRFHSSRIFFALLVVFLAERAISYYSSFPQIVFPHIVGGGPANTALVAVGLLLPLNFVLISFARERGFIFASVGPASVFLFVESVIVAVLCRTDSVAAVQHSHRVAGAVAGTAMVPQHLAFSTGDRVCGGGSGVADTLFAFSQAGGERAAVGAGGRRSGSAVWRSGADSRGLLCDGGFHPGGFDGRDLLSAGLSR